MIAERWRRLSQALQSHGLQALALTPGPSLYYLTGLSFHLMERPVIGLFPPSGRACLVLPELEREKAEASGLDLRLESYGEEEPARAEALSRALSALSLSDGRIGIEPLRMRVMELRLLERVAPSAQFVPAEAVIASLRLAKEAAEVEAMRQAVRAAESALEAALPLVRAGMSERELASELTLQMLRAGSEPELPFPPIVASGPNSALPHAVASDRRLQPGDLVLLDWGASVRGYISDLTRTFSLGPPSDEWLRLHSVVAQANAAGREAVRPGATCADVDRAARAVIASAGYGEAFLHRTGHGIGLEAHEPPYIRGDNPEPLARGMTFTIEPGIYFPGRGGIRIEDNVLVTPEGSDCLTTLPRQLRQIA
ncbi:MAG: Xaa-Pro peptidase family protein [Chloroflexota bacterium]